MTQQTNGSSVNCKLDKTKAFNHAYDKYYGRVYQLANKMIDDKESAKDVITETFLKLWNVWDRAGEIENMWGYIRQIAYNFCVDYLRKEALKSEIHQELLYELKSNSRADYWEDAVRIAIIEKVAWKIDELPPKYRLIYRLYFVDGLDNDEIAERVHISKQSVSNIKFHIVKHLRYSFMEKGELTILLILFGAITQKNLHSAIF